VEEKNLVEEGEKAKRRKKTNRKRCSHNPMSQKGKRPLDCNEK